MTILLLLVLIGIFAPVLGIVMGVLTMFVALVKDVIKTFSAAGDDLQKFVDKQREDK